MAQKAHHPYSVHPGFARMGAKGQALAELEQEYRAGIPQMVEGQFAGPKAELRPLYEKLLAVCLAVGKEAKAVPAKTQVAIYRTHVIANIKIATRTRIDLGLSLGNMRTPARLKDTGGFQKKDRITRRIEITSPADIDADLKKWLKKAYELDG